MSKKIFLRDWLLFKPYNKQSETDDYYLKLSNDVKIAITTNAQIFILQGFLKNDNINHLACFLTSYFEDLISGTNIWNSFVRVHKRLYKKQIPFYILNEYSEEEINIQDLSFLIWYFLNTIQEEDFIDPHNDFIIEIAGKVMNVFEDAWEYAPENINLKSFYQIDKTENDFYIARNLIDIILFKSYLFYTDTSLTLNEKEIEIIDESNDPENIMIYLNENRDSTLHKSSTRLLSLTGKEWAAEILGSDHPLYSDFLNISQKIRGYFLYKGQDQTDVFLEHIASGKKFKLTKKSYDYADNLKKADTIIFMGIVKWRDEWWFSGMQFIAPYNTDLILNEKNSVESKMDVNFLDHKKTAVKELLEKQLKAFKDFNHGLQIAFMPSDIIDEFIRNYTEFFNLSLKLSENEIKESHERRRKEGFFGPKDKHVDFSELSDTGLVFFNLKSGCEIALGVNSAFPLPNNPYFIKDSCEEHLFRLLLDESISPELAIFCIDKCKTVLPFFQKGAGKKYLDDLDFLLRFWKKDNYHTKPSVTILGKDE